MITKLLCLFLLCGCLYNDKYILNYLYKYFNYDAFNNIKFPVVLNLFNNFI